jgi:hypothetical protein
MARRKGAARLCGEGLFLVVSLLDHILQEDEVGGNGSYSSGCGVEIKGGGGGVEREEERGHKPEIQLREYYAAVGRNLSGSNEPYNIP